MQKKIFDFEKTKQKKNKLVLKFFWFATLPHILCVTLIRLSIYFQYNIPIFCIHQQQKMNSIQNIYTRTIVTGRGGGFLLGI